MADTKISALTAATTPLAGTEVLPIVQGGVTRQVSVANLTAGRAISATQLTLTTENLVIGTSGKGIDFSATPGTGTSELLNDYEEGTWTGTFTASVTPPTIPVTTTGTYTKIGRQVTAIIEFSAVNTTGAVGNMLITGLPFTSAASPAYNVGTVGKYLLGASVDIANVNSSSTTINIVDATTTGGTSISAGLAKYIFVSVTYFV
jgi:hypothetical protein